MFSGHLTETDESSSLALATGVIGVEERSRAIETLSKDREVLLALFEISVAYR